MGAVSLIERINKVRSPLNVSFSAQQAAIVSLADEEFKRKVYVRSHGNFILIHVGIDGAEVESVFLKHGIVIRNASEFGFHGFIRVSVGTYEENEKVLAVLKKIIEKPYKQEE